MSNGIIAKVVSQVDYVSTLTLTGGEPSLGTEVIENLVNYTRWRRDFKIGSFYVVTNGRPHNRFSRFLKALDALYELVEEKDSCSLTISRDQFHNFDKSLLRKFWNEWGESEREYFHPENRTTYIDYAGILNEGFAEKNQLGTKDPEQQKPWQVDEEYGYCVKDGLVYVAANGNVVSICDISYARTDAEAKGNVLQTPLREIIESFCVREEAPKEEAA